MLLCLLFEQIGIATRLSYSLVHGWWHKVVGARKTSVFFIGYRSRDENNSKWKSVKYQISTKFKIS